MMSQSTLYFLHINKTGGTTLSSLIDQQFHVNKICDAKVYSELASYSPSTIDQYEFIRGHFGGKVFDNSIKALNKITMLRSPNERIYSHYQHRVRSDINRDVVHLAQAHPFETLIQRQDAQAEYRNFMTRSILYNLNNTQFPFLFREHLEAVRQWKKVAHLENDKPINISWQAAFEELKTYKWFGICERYQDSLNLLCYTMKWATFA